MSRERSNATRLEMNLDMPNVNTSATLWPTMRHEVDGIAREAVRQHTAPVVDFAKHYGHSIPWEYRLKMYASFMAARPRIDVDVDLFMDLFRDAHELWPNGRRLIRRAR
jgi:hypothetical protein